MKSLIIAVALILSTTSTYAYDNTTPFSIEFDGTPSLAFYNNDYTFGMELWSYSGHDVLIVFTGCDVAMQNCGSFIYNPIALGSHNFRFVYDGLSSQLYVDGELTQPRSPGTVYPFTFTESDLTFYDNISIDALTIYPGTSPPQPSLSTVLFSAFDISTLFSNVQIVLLVGVGLLIGFVVYRFINRGVKVINKIGSKS